MNFFLKHQMPGPFLSLAMGNNFLDIKTPVVFFCLLFIQGVFLTVPPNFQYQNDDRVRGHFPGVDDPERGHFPPRP